MTTRIVIVGGGVAGLETLAALHALAGDRLDITLLAPEPTFVNRSMSVDQPFRAQRTRGIRLDTAAIDFGARWHRGTLDRVEAGRRRVITRAGDELPYDRLVIAMGARPRSDWDSQRVLTYRGGQDAPAYRLLLHRLRDGSFNSVAFVKPSASSWPLPLYDLALMTATDCAAHRRVAAELTLITPEEEPLGMFGHAASAAVGQLLKDSGVALHTSSYGESPRPGWLDIAPGGRRMRCDWVVTEPRLVGPRVRGLPCGRDGFIHTDAHGRVDGLDRVFAAGDATGFPVKQGGLAAQQADTVAEAIAASVGIEIDPQPFRPVLRGVLLGGRSPRYLRSDISGRAGDDSTISERALWWPPTKLAGRYLAHYLSSQVNRASDVMPAARAMRFEVPEPLAPGAHRTVRQLSDLTPSGQPAA